MPPKPKGDRAMTGAERVRKYRALQRQKNPVLSDRQKLLVALERVRELEAALAAKPVSKPAKAAAVPKAAKAPLPPDEVRDRQIKALKTRIRNLKQLLSVNERLTVEATTQGSMNFEARSAIAKVLERDKSPEGVAAFKAFNGWKSDHRTARRVK